MYNGVKDYRLFSFSTAQQKKIYEDLKLIGPGPASFFRDACWLMENPEVLKSTSHLVAHLLREIESSLRSILRPITMKTQEKENEDVQNSYQDKEKEISHKKQIKDILKYMAIEESSHEGKAWLELANDLYKLAHREGLREPRSTKDIRDKWEKCLRLFSVILPKLRENFFEWLPVLDDFLNKSLPSEKDIKKLANGVPNNFVTRRYFFERLENPEWLEPLWEKGFFSNPPAPVKDEEEKTIRYQPWPEAGYLARMAKYKPDLVANIIEKMEDTDNSAVHVDLINAALVMPPEISVQISEKAKKWAENSNILTAEKIGELMAHWAKGGKSEEAIELATVLLDVLPEEQSLDTAIKIPPEPRARFEIWTYEKILGKYYAELVKSSGPHALERLCDLLEKAIILSGLDTQQREKEDYSYIWRIAVDENTQNVDYNAKNCLVSAIREAAEEIIRSGNSNIKQVVESLERRGWKIFRRIALHILRLFFERDVMLVRNHLVDRRLFDDVGVRHEYVLLLRTAFNHLSSQDKQLILGWIEEGPDKEIYKKSYFQQKGILPSETDLKRYIEKWQRDRLSWIGIDNLPSEWQQRYKELIAIYGEPELPEFPVYFDGGGQGPLSPKIKEELDNMPVGELITFLKSWEAPKEHFFEPSKESLGILLTEAIAEGPERFALEAPSFKELDPIYIDALIEGLNKGLKTRKRFDWAPVLDLCEWIIKQPREISAQKKSELEPDWGWTRGLIANLLQEGMKTEAISIENRAMVWNVLCPLADDPEPTLEYEEKYGGSNMDPATLSINTIRGKALHAIFEYALWIRRCLEKKSDIEKLEKGFEEMPEVREVLEKHLNIDQDPALSIRSIYGKCFPWLVLLDSKWAEKNACRIFPLSEREQAYFDAAWSTYISFCQPYNNVFGILREQYLHAIKIIGLKDRIAGLNEPDNHLAEHLMTFYWRGKIELIDAILTEFWSKAPDSLRGHAIEFIGRAFKTTEKPVSEEIINRLKALWVKRIESAKNSPEDHEKEMSAFGWWFASGGFDAEWAVKQLHEVLKQTKKIEVADEVLERLAAIAESYPLQAVECLRFIAEGDKEGWLISAVSNDAKKILKVALDNAVSEREAKKTINYLGSRGFLDFRELLK